MDADGGDLQAACREFALLLHRLEDLRQLTSVVVEVEDLMRLCHKDVVRRRRPHQVAQLEVHDPGRHQPLVILECIVLARPLIVDRVLSDLILQ